MSGQTPDAPPCEFSIVIPSRDRPAQLRRCLDALARLDTPREAFEVIVVDDGSREPYADWIGEYAGRLSLRCLRRDGSGPGRARNAGVAEARGRFVALTDDDCEPAPDWLDRFANVLRANPQAMAGGLTVNVLSGNICSEASQTLISYLYDYYARTGSSNRFFTSCNFAMDAGLYRQIGGFDARFRLAGGEDRDFCDRWAEAGFGMEYAPGAVVHHAHHLTLRGFLRQHFTYGRGAMHFHDARASRGGPPVAVEPPAFFTGMLAWPFKQPGLRYRAAISALIGMSVAMNILGFVYERWSGHRATR
ncbi:MAG: glycosyltransferase [Bryobacteraceae bacterium]|nr:glycosyltransferase [Bryobacteraceae bacterium]